MHEVHFWREKNVYSKDDIFFSFTIKIALVIPKGKIYSFKT